MSSLAALEIQLTPAQVLCLHRLPKLFLLLSADTKQGMSLSCVTEQKGASVSEVSQFFLILLFHILSSLLIFLLMFLWNKHLFYPHCSS